MINSCKIFWVIAIRTYWAEQLIFWSKMRISAQNVRIVRIGHLYVLGSNTRLPKPFFLTRLPKGAGWLPPLPRFSL